MTILQSEVYQSIGQFESPGFYYKSQADKTWDEITSLTWFAKSLAQSLYRIKAADVPFDVEPVLYDGTKTHVIYRGKLVYFSRTQPHKR